MMDVSFPAGPLPLRGETFLPGDKSISHRLALLAALAEGESFLDNYLDAGVTRVMLEALTALGVRWELEDGCLRVEGVGGLEGLRPPAAPLDCGHSATTMRLLAGLLAGAGLPAVLDGSPGLRRRPMGRIVRPLQAMGADIRSREGRAPLRLAAREGRLRPLDWRMETASAQVKTCLLLAGLGAAGPVQVTEPIPSRDHTERLFVSLGLDVRSRATPQGWQVTFQPPLRPSWPGLRLFVPGDFSSAAFLLAGAAIVPGSEIVLRVVGLNPGRTGLLDVLQAMGAEVTVFNRRLEQGEPVGDLRLRYAPLRGVQVGGETVVRMIDEFPALAVVAAFAEGQTLVTGAEELRYKESDRIAAIVDLVQALGGEAEARPDGFLIRGGGLQGGEVRPPADHRLAMAAMIAGLGAEGPVVVRGAEIFRQSFPSFLEVLRSLGASFVSD